ncbi:hypothetical protein AVEN_205138-1 [Araneus ventricosus]|uniref:Uncharacterized protein n=1 Tax=Araneus ventricosus TaxID=182803 RepID=A0A4Y2IS95_ARAVE|nr:hypothetical protein AVEN_205138-1 [Araneus ventricosus]
MLGMDHLSDRLGIFSLKPVSKSAALQLSSQTMGWEKEVSKYPNKLKLEDISGYIATVYEGNWWLGYVLQKNEEFD